MTPSPFETDAAFVQKLLQIEASIADGRAADALVRSNELFADQDIPPWRVADLCRLTAEAAQALDMLPLAMTMWGEAAAHAASDQEAADAHVSLGVFLARSQRGGMSSADAAGGARSSFERALALAPDHVNALANLAVLHADAGDLTLAEHLHRRVLELDPENATTHTNLGVLLASTKRLGEAEQQHRQAIALKPESASAHTNLGLLLQQLERFDEAEQHQRRALDFAPRSAAIHSNLGNLLARRGHETQAEALLRKALAIDPNWAAAHCNLGVLLADQLRDAEAEPHFRRALELRPAYPLAQLDLSCLLLAQGRFEEGWRLHEARHDPALVDNGIPAPNVDLPRWRGEPLMGKSLLFWPEQGLGDQIQFCRYVPRLKALGAARITLVCQKPLVALFSTLAGADAVIGADVIDNAFHVDEGTLADHDYWTFPLSAPSLLRTDLTTLPEVAIPYLRAPARPAQNLANASAAHSLHVGLVWRGNPRHNNDAERSLPSVHALAPLWSVPGVRFTSLQAGSVGLAANVPIDGQPLAHIGHELRDFADTAAALETLDLLICVDTSIAHLAGAMGKPCWVMLPHRKTDWRWLRDRDDSPWYPIGMRLFRQSRRGDWAEVMERVRVALLLTSHEARSTLR
jgi:Flp pilus assembly protein TadD